MSENLTPEHRAGSWESLCHQFAAAFPATDYGRVGIVLAISGGADSVALARLVVHAWQHSPTADLRLVTLAHFNHQLRGPAADADQRFVAQLAARWDVNFATETAASQPQSGDNQTASDEATLREQRYRFLRRTLAARGARCLVTAHTADDQIETVLHHLFRGTGPVGLCGIPHRRQLDQDFLLVRPLLGFRRAALRSGLDELGQPWQEDHTNAQTDYSRNWLRHELLPQIRTRYPAADDAILRLIDSQGAWHQLIASQAQAWLESSVTRDQDRVVLRRGDIQPAILGSAIATLWDRLGWPRRDLSAAHYQSLHALVTYQTDRAVTLPGDIQATPATDRIVLRRLPPTQRAQRNRKNS